MRILRQDEKSGNPPEPDEISEENREAVRKIHSLLDELKSVQEHEKKILEE